MEHITGMGARKSKFEEPPLSFKSWRTINWKEKQRALEYVNNYTTSIEGLQIRILLYGPSGAGKSSFINSVQSVLHGRMFAHALAANVHSGCFTKKYTTYKIQKEGPDNFYPFVFNDIMGLSPQGGVLVDDIKLALMGHVKEGYRFNPESKLSEDDPYYVRSPTDNDKVHVLVCVIPAGSLPVMPPGTLQKIRDVRGAASELGIPQVVILTKIGEAYPEIKEDLKSVYRVTSFKNMMEKFSAEVGIPLNCIFPVKNYYEEIDLNNDADSLILSALKNIINFGQDCFNFRMSHIECLD
ncbi:interferon-induced protein 44-like [Halichoeres trimaculatus]|uniref:interferon-induced protein 44-like n=1 Tax=Halichoeres trimaculatus TaxID=147232 RepID=UPI003D9ED787